MTDAPNRFPLAWPPHRPRKTGSQRRPHKFSHGGKTISMAVASDRLQNELDRLGASYAILSTNLELRLDGKPRADRSPPVDPGVCVYFSLKGKPLALACDTFTTVQGNVAALAAHIEALRAQERYGVATAAESLQAFAALPSPDQGSIALGGPRARPWREVMGFSPHFPTGLSALQAKEVVQDRYRERAAKAHPDVAGGSEEAMAELNAARDAGLKEIG